MNAKVLIADDSVHMRLILKDIVIRIGCNVVSEACDGREAIDYFNINKPDIAVLDLSMPIIDGIEALKKIKAENPKAKVIITFSLSQQNKVIDALRSGADDFLMKPFRLEHVEESFARVLK